MALLAGAICGVRNDSCSRKPKYARTSHGMASESLSRGVDLFFCTGILFLETGTRAFKRLKTGKNRGAFDDGSGLAARGGRHGARAGGSDRPPCDEAPLTARPDGVSNRRRAAATDAGAQALSPVGHRGRVEPRKSLRVVAPRNSGR